MTATTTQLNTIEVPREEWRKALLTVSECLLGEPTRIWVDGVAQEGRPLAVGRPLLGISLIEKGSEADAIEVTLGDHGRHDVTHLIQDPAKLHVQEDDHGRTLCLLVDGADGVETLVCFDHGHAPEPGVRRLRSASKKG